jgi:hypothetical protein
MKLHFITFCFKYLPKNILFRERLLYSYLIKGKCVRFVPTWTNIVKELRTGKRYLNKSFEILTNAGLVSGFEPLEPKDPKWFFWRNVRGDWFQQFAYTQVELIDNVRDDCIFGTMQSFKKKVSDRYIAKQLGLSQSTICRFDIEAYKKKQIEKNEFVDMINTKEVITNETIKPYDPITFEEWFNLRGPFIGIKDRWRKDYELEKRNGTLPHRRLDNGLAEGSCTGSA